VQVGARSRAGCVPKAAASASQSPSAYPEQPALFVICA
jgi:hypothetical protein